MQSAKQNQFDVALPVPIEIEGKKVDKLSFREPIGEDMEAFLGEMVPMGGGAPNIGKSVTAIAAQTIVSHPMTEDDIRAMNARNYMAVAMELMGFLL